jgi:hypothetical protein
VRLRADHSRSEPLGSTLESCHASPIAQLSISGFSRPHRPRRDLCVLVPALAWDLALAWDQALVPDPELVLVQVQDRVLVLVLVPELVLDLDQDAREAQQRLCP